MRDCHLGTATVNFIWLSVPSYRSYGIPHGVVYTYPVTCATRDYTIVKVLTVAELYRNLMDATD
jgi:hypothetical protein